MIDLSFTNMRTRTTGAGTEGVRTGDNYLVSPLLLRRKKRNPHTSSGLEFKHLKSEEP